MPVATNSSVRDLEKEKFVDDSNGNTALNVIVQDMELINPDITVEIEPSTIGGTILKTDLTTVEFEIVAVAGQKDIVITSLTTGKVHWSLETGVTTNHASVSRNDQIIVENYAASVFVRLSTGTGTIQIDQRSS